MPDKLRWQAARRALKWLMLMCLLLFLGQLAVAAIDMKIGFDGKVMATLAKDFGVADLAGFLFPLVLILLLLNIFLALAALLGGFFLGGADGERLPVISWLVFSLLWLTIVWENARLFPSSLFAFGIQVPAALVDFPFWYLWGIGALLCLMIGAWHRRQFRAFGAAIVVPVAGAWLMLLSGASHTTAKSVIHGDKPNVFIIGIDSVRIDVVGALGAPESLTPNLDKLLEGGAVFHTAYTPIARTYPSWLGILSGRYPIGSGARVNLMAQEGVDKQALLPVALRESGYRTLYGMDERRFSSIDETYGFDQVVGPPTGIRDFLAQGLRDNPLLNLLVSSPMGRYLLPYHYSNRALDMTYKPADFHRLLSEALSGGVRYEVSTGFRRPLFMTTHFCLPHWPYAWGEEDAIKKTPLKHYQAAVRRADTQVADLVRELRAGGYLENAIVVLLSDHGEAHGLPSDMPFRLDGLPMKPAWGHGTNVLSPTQNRVVLGFVGFGPQAARIRAASHEEVVTLLDVAPTVASLLDIELPWRSDGRSLTELLAGQAGLAESPVFLESEFDLPGVNQANPDVRRLLLEGVGYYHLTSQGRVELTNEALVPIIQAKQRAVIDGDMVLAIYPHHQKARMLLVNQASGQAREMEQASCRIEPVCAHLLLRLESFYGAEIQRNPLIRQGQTMMAREQ